MTKAGKHTLPRLFALIRYPFQQIDHRSVKASISRSILRGEIRTSTHNCIRKDIGQTQTVISVSPL